MPRIGCWDPAGSASTSDELGRGLVDHDVLSTNRLEEVASWLEQERVETVLVVAPDEPQFPIIAEMASCYPRIPLIALVHPEHLRTDSLCRRIVDCCHDYHTLPVDLPRLRVIVGHSVGLYRLCRSLDMEDVPHAFSGMVGKSPIMQALFRDLRKVAAVHAPVLIGGESGTGKGGARRASRLAGLRRSVRGGQLRRDSGESDRCRIVRI